MDPYRTPQSDLIDKSSRPYKPVKGVLAGLGYTILLATLVGLLWAVVIGLILGFDLTSPDIESVYSQSFIYLAGDMVLTAAMLFLGGRAVGWRSPGKELRFGFVLTAITAAIYLLGMFSFDAFTAYPLFYNLGILALVVFVIPIGARSQLNA